MDTNKFREFFAPEKCPEMIHIIGVGATGSTIAESIARMGLTKLTIYDPDTVEPHNIANQLYRSIDVGKKKVDALEEILMDINPEMEITKIDKYDVDNPPQISGYLFIAVDSIELTKQICTDNIMNPNIKCVFNTRIRLTDAQAYSAHWNNYKEKKNLLASMNFTDAEADAETPTSACNMTLSVAPTVRLICSYIVSNFINAVLGKNENFKKMILVDAFGFQLDAF